MYQNYRIWDADFFQISAPQKQENNLGPHEPKFHFLVIPGKQESAGQADLRNLSELKEPPEDPDDQGLFLISRKYYWDSHGMRKLHPRYW